MLPTLRDIYVPRSPWKIAKLVRLVRTIENWPRTLVDHLGLSRANYICRLRDGARLEVRGGTDDRDILFELFMDRVYPVELSEGSIVVDIGAHIGCFTIPAARQGARVFSFEPAPANFIALQRNVELNRLQNVVLFRAAVDGRGERRHMFLPDDHAHTARYTLRPRRGAQTLEVACVSLDDVYHENHLERVDVLKIDAEGSEYEILYSAGADTLTRTRMIIVECDTFAEQADSSIQSLAAYLEKAGFVTGTRDLHLYAIRPAAAGIDVGGV